MAVVSSEDRQNPASRNSDRRAEMSARDSRRWASASGGLRLESLHHESASRDDSHWPSIPAKWGPSPAARVATPRRELRSLGGPREERSGEAASVGAHFYAAINSLSTYGRIPPCL